MELKSKGIKSTPYNIGDGNEKPSEKQICRKCGHDEFRMYCTIIVDDLRAYCTQCGTQWF